MDEELPMISSSPMQATAPQKVKTQDELDLPALKRAQQMLSDQIASYSSVDRLTVEEDDMTVQQQLAVSKAVKAHLTEVKTMIDSVISEIKEMYE